MKLFYCQRPDRQPNFGDDLNRWLWPQLRPNINDAAEVFQSRLESLQTCFNQLF